MWAAEEAFFPGKYHDMNFSFGIVMPMGTPALATPAELGEREVKTTKPPEVGMIPIHWNHVSKCSWEHTSELVNELTPDVEEDAANLAIDVRRREALKAVPSRPKRARKPVMTVALDAELKERVEQALRAVDSTYREHATAFIRWFVRDTDELPSRPDYPLPYFPYGE
ncbi:hypothetical protein ABZ942_19755 [Nocardia sp. NPDC046473]|uniref:hypothetical protein n=1 Tax=Nocardia sp. NPDC046473 TaxID=3155733 RepID=UPI0033E3CB90